MKQFLLLIIKIYQLTLSPDHGLFQARYPFGYCKFYPSCSQYAHEAISHYGSFVGTRMAVARVWRCRPGALPGVDKPVTN